MNEVVMLEQRVVKIKFYLNQTAQNIIEIGKELTAVKNEVPRGQWQTWLESNFQMTERTAQRFMKVAERFGNLTTSSNLNSSQMIELLALSAEETEKFIEVKKAEGNPVENMTVKQLRDVVQMWKTRADNERAKVENLFADLDQVKKENSRLQAKFNTAAKLANQYHVERDILQKQLENQKPITIEPADYQQLKKTRLELQNKIDALQKQLDKKTIEFVTPVDYEDTKKELARLQAEQSKMVQRIQDFKREHPEKFGKMCAAFLDFTESFYEE